MKHLVFFFAILIAIPSYAQSTVKMSAVKGNNYGVAYSLPKTAITVTATVNKKIRKAGEFYQYAERYLDARNPILKDETIYELVSVDAAIAGIPDKENSYLVEFKPGSGSAFVTLTKDGLICAINEELNFTPEKTETPVANTPEAPVVNPKTYLSEEILRAGSTAKQAELVAKQIYRLRESKTDILTGEAENMPPDGNAYKLVMSQIDEQERALTSMFTGTETVETIKKEFTVIPGENNIDKQIVFRFSGKLGIVETDNLAGAPVTLSLTNKNTQDQEVLTLKDQKALEKKFSNGIIYNIPGKANLKIEFDNRPLIQKECDVIQFGTQDVLADKMLSNSKTPVKVIFYPDLGAIRQIVQ